MSPCGGLGDLLAPPRGGRRSYAATLGQGPALAGYLDTHALAGDLPTPFKDFGETSHPWTEHRIDDLEARLENS